MKKSMWIFEKPVPLSKEIQKFGFKVRKKIYSGRSKHQKIEVLDLYHYGRALFLDGILQTTEKDEFIYHEMLCHSPLFAHPYPKKVLIIGGGDGGALKEVLKHSVKEVWMVDVDKKVMEICQTYIPSISKSSLSNERAHLVIEDGRVFLKKYKNYFDIIILDLSDPIGPARHLFSIPFYKLVKQALKKNGIVSLQSGSFGTQPKEVAFIQHRLRKVFRHVEVRKACIQTYQGAEFSFTMASNFDFIKVNKKVFENRLKRLKLKLRYWSPTMHFASAVLPQYLQDAIKTKK